MIGTGIGMLISGLASGGAGVFGAHAQTSAAQSAAKLNVDSANHAADLESTANAQALQFQKDREIERQKEFDRAQQQNYDIYQNETAYTRSQNAAQTARRAPFVNAGTGALGQLLTPINQNRPSGTVGGLLQ